MPYSFDESLLDRPGVHCIPVRIEGTDATGSPAETELAVYAFNAGPGPTVLLTGGVHGDEFEGPTVLARLARSLAGRPFRGRVLMLPVANPGAFQASSRRSPVDGLDLNRAFPGTPDGRVAEVIADFITTRLLPRADVVYDLHAAGHAYQHIPSAMLHFVKDEAAFRRSLEAVLAFAPPAIVLIRELQFAGLFDAEAIGQGKVFGCAELGGGGTVSAASMRVATACVENLLIHAGIVDGTLQKPEWPGWGSVRLFVSRAPEDSLMAPGSGYFEPTAPSGATIVQGGSIGWLHRLPMGSADPEAVRVAGGGMLYLQREAGPIREGDLLATMAHPVATAEELIALNRSHWQP